MPTLKDLADRARGLPPVAVDAVIAGVCWLYVVLQAVLDDYLGVGVVVQAALMAVPLLWRRRYPFTVTLICGTGTTWAAFVGTVGNLPAAQLVATYTFAALCPPVLRLIALSTSVVCATASILIPHDKAINLGVLGITFGVAYVLGTGARARGDRIALLEERARRLAEEQGAAATRERQRIAREMHDILAHSMSVIVVQAEAGPLIVRTDPDKAEDMFDTISDTAREALAQLRRALGVLRSEESARSPQPSIEALTELVAGVRNTGLTVTLSEDGQARPVPPDLAVTAYRIVQESLTNTVKHAAASSVSVRLGWRPDELRLQIDDDGSGPATGERGGHGLAGMRERVAAVGGQLTFGPGPGGTGFRVAVTLPIL